MMLEAEQRGVAMGARFSHFLFSGWKASTVSSTEGWWPTGEKTGNKSIRRLTALHECVVITGGVFFRKRTQSAGNNHSSSYDGCHKVCPLCLHGNGFFRFQPRSCSEYLHIQRVMSVKESSNLNNKQNASKVLLSLKKAFSGTILPLLSITLASTFTLLSPSAQPSSSSPNMQMYKRLRTISRSGSR